MKHTVYQAAIIEGISVPVGVPESEVIGKAEKKMKRAGIPIGSLHFRLYKKSVDARRRDDIRLVYSVLCESRGAAGLREDALARAGAKPFEPKPLTVARGDEPLTSRPLV